MPELKVNLKGQDWLSMAFYAIEQVVLDVIHRKGFCRIMLTGGNTAENLYKYWASRSQLPSGAVRFYFGDERCVPPDHKDSNYGMVMRTLLADHGAFSGCHIVRMKGEYPDKEVAATEYEKLLPDEVDVLLLGMGTDAHIASLFPYSQALESERRVVPVRGPVAPVERLTITPKVINKAKSVFLLATGAQKGALLSQAFRDPKDYQEMPVRLTMNGSWLLDEAAHKKVCSSF